MDYLAIQILAFVKANPGWAMLVIGLTAFVESFVFLSLLFPGTAILIAAGTIVSEGILSPVPTVVAWATRSHSGLARNLDLSFQRYGPFERILSASCAALTFLSAMVFTAFSSGDSLPVTRGRPGATGFMPSSIEPSMALQALSFIKSGGSFFPPSALSRGTTPAITFVEKPAATIQSGQTVGPHQLMDRAGSLTSKQEEVFNLLRQGQTNKLIARKLGMSEATVKVHVRRSE